MTEEKRKPPYAPVKGLRDFFERVTQNKQPAHVDRAYLAGLGVASGNEQHVVAALKFLGLIEGGGRPTARFNDLYLKSAERKRSLQLLLRRAYPGLFTGELDLRAATRPELHDFFVRHYGMQGQMARKAAAVFVFLASLAGIALSADLAGEGRATPAERDGGERRRRLQRPVPVAQSPQVPASGSPVAAPLVAAGSLSLTLLVTPEMDEDQIADFVRRVRRAVARVATEDEAPARPEG